MVGIDVREEIEDNVNKYNPFNKNRSIKYSFNDKPQESVFCGLTENNLKQFIARRKKEYDMKYKY